MTAEECQRSKNKPRSAAVELYMPSGGSLAPLTAPAESGNITIRVYCNESQTNMWNRPFGVAYDLAYVGLLRAYAESAAEGFQQADLLGPGKVIANCAAYAEVSSSPVVFRQLAKFVARHLAAPTLTTSIRTAIRRQRDRERPTPPRTRCNSVARRRITQQARTHTTPTTS